MTCRLTAASTEATETSESAAAEHTAEHRENVVHGESATTAETAPALQSFKTELVILLALLWVVQNIVSLSRFLEFLFGVFVAGVTVGVVLDGYLAIGFFDIIFRGILVYTKHLVIVTFCHYLI